MEIMEKRCSMCTLKNKDLSQCPLGLGSQGSICNFVVAWTDSRGWKYRVMSGIGENRFKGRYQDEKHNGNAGWKGMRQLPWRESFDEAQEDLNSLATAKKWSIL